MARVVDLSTVIDVLRGKLEFESGEEGREQAVLEHLLRRATADTASRVLGGIDVGTLVSAVESGSAVTTGEKVSAKDVLAAVPGLPVRATSSARGISFSISAVSASARPSDHMIAGRTGTPASSRKTAVCI